jgi:FkbM family methyltransferase
MSTISKAINRLGFWKGLSTYFQLRTNQTELRLPELKHPVYIRHGSSDGSLFRQIFYDGEYDLEIPFEPKYIIDGGANIGFFAVLMANRYPNARIISIEPDSRNFELLRRNTAPYLNIVPVQSGIWNKEVSLQVIDQGYGEWGLMVKEVAPGTAGSFDAVSIAGIMKQYAIPQLDVIKLDVEGAEEFIFADHYHEWIPKTKMMIIELHERMKPRSADNFWKAMSNYSFSKKQIGENIIFINQQPG